MKTTLQNLTRKLLLRLDKALDMPKYRIKHDDTMVHVTEHSVTFSRRNDTRGAAFEITRECYFAVKDKIKSFDKKNETNKV